MSEIRSIPYTAFFAFRHVVTNFSMSTAEEIIDAMSRFRPSAHYSAMPEEAKTIIGNRLRDGVLELDSILREMYLSGELLVDGMTYEEFCDMSQTPGATDGTVSVVADVDRANDA